MRNVLGQTGNKGSVSTWGWYWCGSAESRILGHYSASPCSLQSLQKGLVPVVHVSEMLPRVGGFSSCCVSAEA